MSRLKEIIFDNFDVIFPFAVIAIILIFGCLTIFIFTSCNGTLPTIQADVAIPVALASEGKAPNGSEDPPETKLENVAPKDNPKPQAPSTPPKAAPDDYSVAFYTLSLIMQSCQTFQPDLDGKDCYKDVGECWMKSAKGKVMDFSGIVECAEALK